MTYGEMKERVKMLLDVTGDEAIVGSGAAWVAERLPHILSATARKTALYLRCFVREETLNFTKGAIGISAELPTDAVGVRRVFCADKHYGCEAFEVIGKKIYLFENREGAYTCLCEVYPAALPELLADTTVLSYEEVFADAVAFGAAASLSHSLYPSDMARYMYLMTEYDERITLSSEFPRGGEKRIQNTFFGGKRGVF